MARDRKGRKIPILRINMMTGDETEILTGKLKDSGLYSPSLLYAGINGADVRELLRRGSLKGKILGWHYDPYESESEVIELLRSVSNINPEDCLFAGTEWELQGSSDLVEDPFECAFQYDKRAMAMYDWEAFENFALGIDVNFSSLRRFKDPEKKLDPLVAVAHLRYEEET